MPAAFIVAAVKAARGAAVASGSAPRGKCRDPCGAASMLALIMVLFEKSIAPAGLRTRLPALVIVLTLIVSRLRLSVAILSAVTEVAVIAVVLTPAGALIGNLNSPLCRILPSQLIDPINIFFSLIPLTRASCAGFDCPKFLISSS